MELVKYKDESGKVGVIYSPCFGIEWIRFEDPSADYAKFLISDYELVKAVIEEDNVAFKERFDKITEHFKVYHYPQSVSDLEVYFMKEGTVFETSSNDGREQIFELGSDYLVA